MKKSFLLLAVASLTLGGCLLTDSVKDRLDAVDVVPNSLGSFIGSPCGVRGFAYYLHPQLRARCSRCHGGAGPGAGQFAQADAAQSYSPARARVNLSQPTLSRIYAISRNAQHGDGLCTDCGPEWGDTFASLVSEWNRAEMNQEPLCTTLAQEIGDLMPFDDGVFNPGAVAEVEINAAGLAEFRSDTGGSNYNALIGNGTLTAVPGAQGTTVHGFLRTHCIGCHVPASGSGGAAHPFAFDDLDVAYKAAFPKAELFDPANSAIVRRINNPDHGKLSGNGQSCVICGNNPATRAYNYAAHMTNLLRAWAAAEATGLGNRRVTLAHKEIVHANLAVAGSSVNLTWNLALNSDVALIGSNAPPVACAGGGSGTCLQGTFSVTVRRVCFAPVAGGCSEGLEMYEVSNPRLNTGGATIRLKEISFLTNRMENLNDMPPVADSTPATSIFLSIDRLINSSSAESLSPGIVPALVDIPLNFSTDGLGNVALRFRFGILERQ